ncbi:MAG: FAD-binding oxidoreductase [Solirubrobacteraceae bacterium]
MGHVRTHTALARRLAAIVGRQHVLADADVRAPFERDWTGLHGGPASLVVRPADAGEVAAVVAECAQAGIGIVPQGGNTGLVGGGVPRRGEVVVSLVRLNMLSDVDCAAGDVEAGAGVPLAALQRHARAVGMDAAVDFGARDSATVGGLVATDAGGIRALRHGTAGARVTGVEAVMADGAVVDRCAGLLKDNAGYDLTALLVGSEGTLGIVTRVRWRLAPLLTARVAALAPVGSVEDAVALLATVRPLLPSLEAADFFADDALSYVLRHLGAAPPLEPRARVYVLLECAAHSDPTEELTGALVEAGVEDAILADDTAGRARLWRLREAIPEAIAASRPHALDVGLPVARIAEFAERVPGVAEHAQPGATTILFGHLGDGNLHVNVLGLPAHDDSVDEAVLRLAAECGGTISAEHGVGVAKARWLGLVRGDAELRAMRAIKSALDPAGILNPGVVLPAPDH